MFNKFLACCDHSTSVSAAVPTVYYDVVVKWNSFITNVDMVALYNNVTLLSLIKVLTSD